MATTTKLGTLLREGRAASKMTQTQVGEAVGMLQSSVSGWESGKVVPGITHLLMLADVLGLDYGDLFEAAVADYAAAR